MRERPLKRLRTGHLSRALLVWCITLVLFGLTRGPAAAPDLVIAPKALKLSQVQGGPLAVGSILIRAAGEAVENWTAAASTSDPNDPWLQISVTAGRTPASLGVGLVPWRGEQRKPGTYHARITIRTKSSAESIPVDWEVHAPLPPPAVSYLAGPKGCNRAEGYPDAPLCAPLPMPELAGPPRPGTTYTDPNFGAAVKVLTGAPVYHTYSTPSPLSARAKYLMAFPEDGTWNILDARNGKMVFPRVPCNQSFFWDARDDEVYYYLRGATVLKHDLRRNKDTVLVDYSRQEPRMREILRGGTGDTSKDNWISFWAPDEHRICALDLNAVKTYCGDYSASQGRLPYGDIDFTLVSKGIDRQSGKRYVLLIAPPAMGVFSVDVAKGALALEFRGPESPESRGNHDGICDRGEKCLVGSHLDTMEDSAGIQYFVMNAETSSPCEVSSSTYQLNKGKDIDTQLELGGGRRKVLTLWRCGPGWVDEHVGCAKASPYCVISTQNVPRSSGDASSFTPTPHAGEILVMRENGAEIRPLALTRSAIVSGAGGQSNYWSTPRAAISGDGSIVVSDSNFGDPHGQRVTLIQTGWGRSQPAGN